MTYAAFFRMIAIGALAAAPAVVHAQNFILPDTCGKSATGATDDPLYAALAPLVYVTYNIGKNATAPPQVAKDKDNRWYYKFYAPVSGTYFLVASYTPFLQSYTSMQAKGAGFVDGPLPAPGSVNDARTFLLSSVTFTVTTEPGGGKAMPNAYLEMAPDLVVPGAPPYTLVADDNGQITIDCFMAYAAGNSATVYTADSEYAYDALYKFSKSTSPPYYTLTVTAIGSGGDTTPGKK